MLEIHVFELPALKSTGEDYNQFNFLLVPLSEQIVCCFTQGQTSGEQWQQWGPGVEAKYSLNQVCFKFWNGTCVELILKYTASYWQTWY